MRSSGLRRGLVAVLGLAAGSSAGILACGGDDTRTPVTTGTGAAGATGGGSGATGGGATGGSGGGAQVCGDGAFTAPELCDDGNGVNGDGCENDCSFSCTRGTPQGDAKCDDGDPCDGAETCSDAHTCTAGTPQADGTDCGNGKVCKAGTCGDVTCGDGFVDPGEDCDDANLDPADGCNNCAFTCLVDGDCDPVDGCQGTGVCAPDHSCSTENPPAEGTSCPGGACDGGLCLPVTCGDGIVGPGEGCDDGNIVGGDGCQPNCQLSCSNAAMDCPAAPPCNMAVCSAAQSCATAPDVTQNGDSCGADLLCSNGACLGDGVICGDGAVEAGEECDFGAANGPGTGCEETCKFSCSKAPDSCPDQNACNGVEACNTVAVSGKLGQRCSVGSSLPNCSACGPGICAGATCVPSTCGDGCVDASKGESCEPPNGATCDAACKTQICGNGVRESSEQCDDGNTKNLDGCSAGCKLEQLQRVRYLVLQYATDVLCAQNQLGAAVVGQTAQSQLQQAIDDGVQAGSIDFMLQFLALNDLSGTVDPSLQLGTMNGAPKKLGQPYDGASDLDSWHAVNPATVDANNLPLALLPAQIAAKSLTAGPGSLSLGVSFGAGPATLSLSAVSLAITIGPANAPLLSAGNLPPGHVAAENLDPALVSFATAGQTNANGAGKLCGNVSAASLAAVPVPEQLTVAPFGCSEGYSLQNSMLDVIAGGCSVFGAPQIAATQPDEVDSGAPVAGAGAPYTLGQNALHAVTTCSDKNGAQVALATCLNAAAYSSFFKVATNRVIVK